MKQYMEGFKDGTEVFKHHMRTMLAMDTKNLKSIFGESSVAMILNNNTADEIMARMGDKRCIIAD